jgi:two-component system phosphate regulon sensor histidine kinase PhoR
MVEGKFYWEVLREPNFSDLIKKVQQEKRSRTEELSLDEKSYLCSATYLDSRGETVITLHDITEVKKVEKIKKDFIMNISHELRTPLTAIKGFVETLEEEVDRDKRHYLEIIKRHTDRLINIVKDLLILSELEEKETKLEVEEVDVAALVKDIMKIFEQKLKDKRLEVEVKVEEKIPSVKGDPFKLEQMFINLIDNAVKYTEKGKITIAVERKEDRIAIEVKDTGIGIPREHISRVFERFYVVDKSRSKRLGGTGLGLSIVKHIALLHGGEVAVESDPGKGTSFTVLLPV